MPSGRWSAAVTGLSSTAGTPIWLPDVDVRPFSASIACVVNSSAVSYNVEQTLDYTGSSAFTSSARHTSPQPWTDERVERSGACPARSCPLPSSYYFGMGRRRSCSDGRNGSSSRRGSGDLVRALPSTPRRPGGAGGSITARHRPSQREPRPLKAPSAPPCPIRLWRFVAPRRSS